MSMIVILAGATIAEQVINGVRSIYIKHYNRTHYKRRFVNAKSR